MKKTNLILLVVFLAPLAAWGKAKEGFRPHINLHGTWQFRLDPDGTGVEQQLWQHTFADKVALPGTTDTNRKGNPIEQKDVTTHLSRNYSYVGKAWYKKKIEIPKDWADRHIALTLERSKPTRIWVDGKEAGTNDNLSTPQVYDLTPFLSPGTHEIAILVDNGKSVPPQLLENSHAYTESTQTNWNGMIGEIFLEARKKLHIEDIQVYPDAKKKTVRVKVKIASPGLLAKGASLTLDAHAWNTAASHRVKTAKFSLAPSQGTYEFDYPLGDEAVLWSEFHPVLYKLEVTLKGSESRSVNFGLRDFKTRGTQFTINNKLTFLRGKHDACVFPLTAHTAMDVETWRHYFQVAKSYGINHYRFHSWCPPKACFEAADIEGIYLQPELPFWGALHKKDEYLVAFLKKEGIHIQHEYGNHASFVLFALGNELSGDLEAMEQMVSAFREVDSRHLYAFGSNNYLGFKGQLPGEDFLVTCRIGGEEPRSFNTHTRGSFSFADAYDGGYLNHTYPNTVMDFSSAIARCSVPVISHETGQFQVYPNYEEIRKYTGVLYPYNMEVFRKRLEEAGMLEQAGDFFRASGKWAVELYKADIEMDLRTPGFGGFQLLDLQDYPGQGSAYVGILDAFMDSKGLVTPEKWREFCSEIVPLLVIEKFCWLNTEQPSARLKIANYSENPLEGKELIWELKTQQGHTVDTGKLKLTSAQAGLIDLGEINPQIAAISKAQRLDLYLTVSGTPHKNSYPLWVYPGENEIGILHRNTVADSLSREVTGRLEKGEKVLWFPNHKTCEGSTVGGLFQTDYWNYRMFKSISEWNKQPVSPGTLGILTDPGHPLFSDFPTEEHTNWQWFPVIKHSRPLILDRLDAKYKPLVQVIDNIERNHKLGLIFEFAVGEGKLLVCMSDPEELKNYPEGRQLYKSILSYMDSGSFNPSFKLTPGELKELFGKPTDEREIKKLGNISYDN